MAATLLFMRVLLPFMGVAVPFGEGALPATAALLTREAAAQATAEEGRRAGGLVFLFSSFFFFFFWFFFVSFSGGVRDREREHGTEIAEGGGALCGTEVGSGAGQARGGGRRRCVLSKRRRLHVLRSRAA
eukprot:2364363-Rhodomonas_salina.3